MEWRLITWSMTVITSLNPYYNGRYSWSAKHSSLPSWVMLVLILIIMEDTHGEQKK